MYKALPITLNFSKVFLCSNQNSINLYSCSHQFSESFEDSSVDEESEDEKDLETQMEIESGEGSTDNGKHHMKIS